MLDVMNEIEETPERDEQDEAIWAVLANRLRDVHSAKAALDFRVRLLDDVIR